MIQWYSMFVSKQLKFWFMFKQWTWSCSIEERWCKLRSSIPMVVGSQGGKTRTQRKVPFLLQVSGLGKVSYVISSQVSYLHDLHVFHIYIYIYTYIFMFQGFSRCWFLFIPEVSSSPGPTDRESQPFELGEVRHCGGPNHRCVMMCRCACVNMCQHVSPFILSNEVMETRMETMWKYKAFTKDWLHSVLSNICKGWHLAKAKVITGNMKALKAILQHPSSNLVCMTRTATTRRKAFHWSFH